MSQERAIQDLERGKFVETTSSAPAVRVVNAGLLGVQYDYFSVAYPDSVTEIYTFKSGGSSGVTQRVVSLIYTDSTKQYLSSGEIVS
jgi:hypothetical protein